MDVVSGGVGLSEAIARNLRARVILDGWPPPPGFSPPGETAAAIAAHDLPVPPDPVREPRAHANWLAALSGRLDYVAAEIDHLDAIFAVRLLPLCSAPATIRTGARFRPLFSESSGNWSGAYIRPSSGGRFTRVQGAWTVPEPCPDGAHRAALADGEYAVTTWIGLDGYDAGTLALAQCGTGQFATVEQGRVTGRQYAAFWEWWARDAPEQSWAVTIRPDRLRCQPGDRFHCELDVLAPDRVMFFFKNESAGQVLSFAVRAPLLPESSMPATIAGRTAEWVVERPSDWITLRRFTLADFSPIAFERCAAVETEEEQLLDAARLIRLADWSDREVPGTVVAEPAALGREQVSVRYAV
jgi:hypothetical protein